MYLKCINAIGILFLVYGASTSGQLISNKKRDLSLNYPGDGIALAESTDNLIWFIQISDLHISQFHDQKRITDFQKFCNVTVDVIKPSVVLASGDLVDSMNENDISSTQHKREWQIYNSILRQNDIQTKTVWLDVRGNHDNYDVASLLSANNYYQNFSQQGPHHDGSYMYSLRKGSNTVAFIAVDAAQLPGPKRPYNFVGILHEKDMELLQLYEKEARYHNYTIWFGHYPTASILSPKPGLRKLMGRGLAYMCGHFHTGFGHFLQLYAVQNTGSLELELVDWRMNRLYRVVALDNGLLSFVDIKQGSWPVILITNPKDAHFFIHEKEPISLIGNSSHIRVLVWSPAEIKRVSYRINDRGWTHMNRRNDPLYTARWQPRLLTKGIHIIEVMAMDSGGSNRTVRQSFSVDGESVPLEFTSRMLLQSNLTLLFQVMFGCVMFLAVVPLCIVRIIHYRTIAKVGNRPRCRFSVLTLLLRKIWILASVNRLFYPLVLTYLYIPMGPWFIGEILNGHVGATFVWGTFVYGSYIRGSLTYLYGFLQMLTFHLPILILSAAAADSRYQLWNMRRKTNVIFSLINHILFATVIFNQAKNAYKFYVEYGTMTFLLGPVRTWSVLVGIYIWFASSTLRRNDLRSAALVWKNNLAENGILE